MATRNELIEDIVIAAGGIIDPPKTRNNLLQQWLNAVDGTNPIFQTDYTCQHGIEPRLGTGPATYTCATTAQYSAACNILDRYIYGFDGAGYITIPEWSSVGDFEIEYELTTDLSSIQVAIGSTVDVNTFCATFTDGVIQFKLSGQSIASGLGAIKANIASRVKIQRVSNITTLFVDGVSVASGGQSGALAINSIAANPSFPLKGSIYNLSLTSASGNRFYPIDDNDTVIRDTLGDGSTDGTLANGDPANWIYDEEGVIRTAAIDQPRIEKEGVLLGGPVTNLLVKSNDFADVAWLKTSVGVGASALTSPSGQVDALELSASVATSTIRQNFTVAPDTECTFTFWASRGTMLDAKYSVYDFTNLTNIVAPTSYYNELIAGEWVKVTVGFKTGLTTTLVGVYPLRDSVETGSIHIWQADVVELPFPVNPIYTDTAAVIQAATNLTYPVPAGFDPAEFSIEVEFDLLGLGAFDRVLEISGGGVAAIEFVINGASGEVILVLRSGGVAEEYSSIGAVAIGESQRLVVTGGFGGKQIQISLGGSVATYTGNNLTIPTVDKLKVGGRLVGIDTMHGHVKSLKISDYDVLGG